MVGGLGKYINRFKETTLMEMVETKELGKYLFVNCQRTILAKYDCKFACVVQLHWIDIRVCNQQLRNYFKFYNRSSHSVWSQQVW